MTRAEVGCLTDWATQEQNRSNLEVPCTQSKPVSPKELVTKLLSKSQHKGPTGRKAVFSEIVAYCTRMGQDVGISAQREALPTQPSCWEASGAGAGRTAGLGPSTSPPKWRQGTDLQGPHTWPLRHASSMTEYPGTSREREEQERGKAISLASDHRTR